MLSKLIPWLISGIALVLAIVGWGQNLGWQLYGISIYGWFPLFGLIAFSLMWSHYAVDFLGYFLKFQIGEGPYLRATRYIVFFALLLHPGLLAWKRWHEDFGLPPMAWLDFVEPSAWLGIIIGITAWLAFLGFELHYWFRNKSWFKWIIWANACAMILVVIHVLYLAEPTGWFRYLWYFYGISLTIIFIKDILHAYNLRKINQ